MTKAFDQEQQPMAELSTLVEPNQEGFLYNVHYCGEAGCFPDSRVKLIRADADGEGRYYYEVGADSRVIKSEGGLTVSQIRNRFIAGENFRGRAESCYPKNKTHPAGGARPAEARTSHNHWKRRGIRAIGMD